MSEWGTEDLDDIANYQEKLRQDEEELKQILLETEEELAIVAEENVHLYKTIHEAFDTPAAKEAAELITEVLRLAEITSNMATGAVSPTTEQDVIDVLRTNIAPLVQRLGIHTNQNRWAKMLDDIGQIKQPGLNPAKPGLAMQQALGRGLRKGDMHTIVAKAAVGKSFVAPVPRHTNIAGEWND